MIIKAEGLGASYGAKTVFENLSFEIEKGEIFGILGPNGAGKTTLISVLSTAMPPRSGSLEILGLDAAKDFKAIRKKIGVVFQGSSIDPGLTGFENLELSAALYAVTRSERKKRIETALEIGEIAFHVGYDKMLYRKTDVRVGFVNYVLSRRRG